MTQSKTTLLLPNLIEITFPISSKSLVVQRIYNQTPQASIQVTFPFRVLLQKIEVVARHPQPRVTQVCSMQHGSCEWRDVIDFKKQKVDWRFKSRMRSNSNEFIEKLPLYLGQSSSSKELKPRTLDGPEVLEDEDEWEDVQGTLVSCVSRQFLILIEPSEQNPLASTGVELQALQFHVWPTFRTPTSSASIPLINTSFLLSSKGHESESEELEFLVAQSLLAGRKFIQASEKLRSIQKRLLNQSSADDIYRAMLLEVLIGESMNQHSQINEKIFAFRRCCFLFYWLQQRSESDASLLQEQLDKMAKDSIKQEEACIHLIQMKQPLVQALLQSANSQIEAIRNASLRSIEFLLDNLGCNLDGLILDILNLACKLYPQMPSVDCDCPTSTDEAYTESFFHEPYYQNFAQATRTAPAINPRALLNQKAFIIRDSKALAQSVTQSTRNSLNHILENVNVVLGSTTSQIALQVLRRVLLPNCFDAQLAVDLRVYLIRFATRVIQINKSDITLPNPFLSALFQILLDSNETDEQPPCATAQNQANQQLAHSVQQHSQSALTHASQMLLETIKRDYLHHLNEKASQRIKEWLLSMFLPVVEMINIEEKQALGARDARKVDLLLDLVERMIDAQLNQRAAADANLQTIFHMDQQELAEKSDVSIESNLEVLSRGLSAQARLSKTLRYLQLILPLAGSLISIMNYAIANKQRLALFKQVWRILVKLLKEKPPSIKPIQSLTVENLITPHLVRVNSFCKQSSPSREMLEFLILVLQEFQNPSTQIEATLLPTIISVIPHSIHDEVFMVTAKLLDLTHETLTGTNLRLLVNMLVHKYTMRSQEHKNLVFKLLHHLILMERSAELYDAFCDECLFSNQQRGAEDETFFEKLGLVEQLISLLGAENLWHFQRLIGQQARLSYERCFMNQKSLAIAARMVLGLSHFYVNFCEAKNIYEHPILVQTQVAQQGINSWQAGAQQSVNVAPQQQHVRNNMRPNLDQGRPHPIHSEPSAELFSVREDDQDPLFNPPGVEDQQPRIEMDPNVAPYVMSEIDIRHHRRSNRQHYNSMQVDYSHQRGFVQSQAQLPPSMAELNDNPDLSASEYYESPRQPRVQLQTMLLRDTVSIINTDRLSLIQISAALIKLAVDSADEDSNQRLNALCLMQNLFARLLPTPSIYNMAVQNLILQGRIQLNMVQSQAFPHPAPPMQIYSSQVGFSSNSSQHNHNNQAPQVQPGASHLELIPDFSDLVLQPTCDSESMQNQAQSMPSQQLEPSFPDQFECWDQKYLCSRVVMLLKVCKYLETIFRCSSWQSLKSLALSVFASACNIGDVSKLPSKLQRHLKNSISPLLIRMIQSKDCEMKAGALQALSALSNMQTHDFQLSQAFDSAQTQGEYQIQLTEHLDLFRSNLGFISVAIWQEVFDLQDDPSLLIRRAASALIQLCAPSDSVTHFLKLKQAQFKLKVNELLRAVPNLEWLSSQMIPQSQSPLLPNQAQNLPAPHGGIESSFTNQLNIGDSLGTNPPALMEIDSKSYGESGEECSEESDGDPNEQGCNIEDLTEPQLRKILELFELKYLPVSCLQAERPDSTEVPEEQRPSDNQPQQYKLPTSLMDFFEDSLLEDVINFAGKKHRPEEDDEKSQSSDEIYIFKRQEENSDQSLKQILSQPTTSLVIHQHLQQDASNEDLGIIDLDNQSGEDFEELDDDKLPVLKNTYSNKNRPNNSKSVAVGSRSQGGTIKARKITVVRTVESKPAAEDTKLRRQRPSDVQSLDYVKEVQSELPSEFDFQSEIHANSDVISLDGLSAQSLPLNYKRRQIQSAGGKREHSSSARLLSSADPRNLRECDIEEVQIYVRQRRKRRPETRQSWGPNDRELERLLTDMGPQLKSPEVNMRDATQDGAKKAAQKGAELKRAPDSIMSLPSSQAFLSKHKSNQLPHQPQIKVIKKSNKQKSLSVKAKPPSEDQLKRQTGPNKRLKRSEIRLDPDDSDEAHEAPRGEEKAGQAAECDAEELEVTDIP